MNSSTIAKKLRTNLQRGDANGDRGFARWLDTFLSEKGIDLDATIEAEGASGTNWIPVACLVEMMKAAPAHEQRGIKSMLVRIDFVNAPVMPYLAHLAKAVAQ